MSSKLSHKGLEGPPKDQLNLPTGYLKELRYGVGYKTHLVKALSA